MRGGPLSRERLCALQASRPVQDSCGIVRIWFPGKSGCTDLIKSAQHDVSTFDRLGARKADTARRLIAG
jgi:hypothetical protein